MQVLFVHPTLDPAYMTDDADLLLAVCVVNLAQQPREADGRIPPGPAAVRRHRERADLSR